MRSGKRLINGPALSTLPSLALLSPSKWGREGICIPALTKTGEQVRTVAMQLTVSAHTTYEEAHHLVCNQRDFVADYQTLCHGSFFTLV